jgi:hypothetical protein
MYGTFTHVYTCMYMYGAVIRNNVKIYRQTNLI